MTYTRFSQGQAVQAILPKSDTKQKSTLTATAQNYKAPEAGHFFIFTDVKAHLNFDGQPATSADIEYPPTTNFPFIFPLEKDMQISWIKVASEADGNIQVVRAYNRDEV